MKKEYIVFSAAEGIYDSLGEAFLEIWKAYKEMMHTHGEAYAKENMVVNVYDMNVRTVLLFENGRIQYCDYPEELMHDLLAIRAQD